MVIVERIVEIWRMILPMFSEYGRMAGLASLLLKFEVNNQVVRLYSLQKYLFVSRVSIDTPCLNGHHGLVGHY